MFNAFVREEDEEDAELGGGGDKGGKGRDGGAKVDKTRIDWS